MTTTTDDRFLSPPAMRLGYPGISPYEEAVGEGEQLLSGERKAEVFPHPNNMLTVGRPEMFGNNVVFSDNWHGRTGMDVSVAYGEVRNVIVLSGDEDVHNSGKSLEEPFPNSREIGRVLAWYPGALETLLILADMGPLPAKKVSDEAPLEGNSLEVIVELRKCDLIAVKRETIILTDLGRRAIEKLRELTRIGGE